MTMETYGRPDLSVRYSKLSPLMIELLCDGATKGEVIPLLTTAKSSKVPAWNAEVQRLFKRGRIPRIFMLFRHAQETTIGDTISRLRDTFQVPNASYSTISSVPGKTLICASYSKETEKQPPASPTSSTPLSV